MKLNNLKHFLKKLIIANFLIILINFDSFAEPYFSSKILQFDLIDLPLNRSSKEYKKELSQIIAIQSKIDLDELELSAQEKNFTALTLIKRANISVNPKKNPQLFALLKNVTDTSISITDDFKNHFKTTRPYLADSRVKMLISPSKGYAYPSGHTTGSYIYAHVLGMIYPKKYSKLKEIAEEIAQHRVLVGMHFPHDIEGGKKLALLITGALTANNNFQQDLLKAKKEINFQ
jgi:acid phosphatase (class A)